MNRENPVSWQVIANVKQAASPRGQTHSECLVDIEGPHTTAHRPRGPYAQYPTWNSEALDGLDGRIFAQTQATRSL